MTPTPSADEVFAAALALTDPSARSAYLDRTCAGKAGLREEVESLLAAATRAGTFLESPLSDAAAVLRETSQPIETPLAERAGSRIGRYKLLEQIGEGGFGVVWMAEQEEPVRRRVALKIIKLGMDTREVVARFEAERQALALMDHPNIAKVLDGGATDTGRPYFVMDLVKGVPITKFCDERRLSTRQRLELFMQVCHAVQHAHQKGIIHRDLKPSNLLVTVQDDRPLPKVIDFGVAKATQARLTEKTLFTRLQQWIGTPAYMSPEQAGLGSLDVDTRSDVYSLGVVLYELLTGRTPFDTQKLLAAGYEAVMRTIREEDPPKPSTRLSTLKGEELSTAAAQRGSEPAKLNRLVRGDLDWIVMKCLEKDRTRRYGGADGLALDIERHLRHEPVTAAAPGAVYWARKFVRRHRVGLGMAAALLALLVVGTVVSAWQAVRATRAERAQTQLRQQAERARANETTLREKAEELGAVARSQARQISHQLYASHMSLAFQAWEKGDLVQVGGLLARHRPQTPEDDHRGFEWHYLWQLCHSAQLTLLGHDAKVRCVTFSPNGRLVATAGDDATARVWDARSGKELLQLRGHTDLVTAAAFAPDGRSLATASNDRTVRVWDTETGQELALLWGHNDGVSAVAYGPEGQWLVSATGRPAMGTGSPSAKFVFEGLLPAEIKVWDFKTRKTRLALMGHTGSILSLAVSPDGKRLATAATDARARVWDLQTGRLDWELTGFRGLVLAVAFSPDGQTLALGGGDPHRESDVTLWDLATRKQQLAFKRHEGPVFALAFSPDGTTVASGGLDQTVRLWSRSTGEELRNIKGHKAAVWSLAFDPSSQRIATASWDGSAKIWDAQQPEGRRLLPGASSYSTCFSPDGRFLVMGGARIEVLDLTANTPPFSLPAYGANDLVVAVAPDGGLLASGGEDRLVTLWEVGTWRRLGTLGGHESKIWQLAFSPDSRILLSQDEGGVRFWDVAPRKERAQLRTGPSGPVLFNPDGRTLIRCELERTVIADTETLTAQRVFPGMAFVWGAVTPDGRYLAGRRLNSDVQLVDLENGKERWLAHPHRADVWALSISPDGKTVATASWDGSAKLINAAGGQVMFTCRAPGVVWSSNFSPDGKWWAVGSGSAREGETVLFRAATPSEVLETDSPAIVTQPSSQIATEDIRTSLRVVASGAAPLLYQWQRDGQPLAGETNATLTFANLSTAQAGNYRVVLSNDLGTVTSSNATLKVLQVREAPIAEATFEGDDPSLWCGSYASAEKPDGLATRAERMPGTGIRDSGGLVVTADATVLQAGSKQAWCGFAATIIARANRTTLVDTTDLALYKLSASARTSGLTGSSARGSLQWQFRTADAALLTLSVPIVLTTNYQTYSYILANAPTTPACGGSWGEFVTRFDQIDRLQCAVAVDEWVGDYGTDADNALYVDDVRFVRLVPVTPAGSTEPTAGAPPSKKQAAR